LLRSKDYIPLKLEERELLIYQMLWLRSGTDLYEQGLNTYCDFHWYRDPNRPRTARFTCARPNEIILTGCGGKCDYTALRSGDYLPSVVEALTYRSLYERYGKLLYSLYNTPVVSRFLLDPKANHNHAQVKKLVYKTHRASFTAAMRGYDRAGV
jgi:hypothetical protein